eukprot:m.217010 g.217010  ORF g.217010 m.217010 type:complete len:66 (+) comp17203_c0_seq15:3092-3289(+)
MLLKLHETSCSTMAILRQQRGQQPLAAIIAQPDQVVAAEPLYKTPSHVRMQSSGKLKDGFGQFLR